MKFILLAFFCTFSAWILGQSNPYILPSTDLDSTEINSIYVSINDVDSTFTILSFTEDSWEKSYYHKEYIVPLAILDTVILTSDKAGKMRGVTFYFCNDRQITESFVSGFRPVKRKKKTIRKKVFGGWSENVDITLVQKMAIDLNNLSSNNNSCHTSYSNIYSNMVFFSGPSIGEKVVYKQPDKMPIYNNSNSIESRNNNIQAVIDRCFEDSISLSSVLTGNMIIDEKGTIGEIFIESSLRNNPEIKSQAKQCLKEMGEWTAGEHQGVKVKSEISFITGINMVNPILFIQEYQIDQLANHVVEKAINPSHQSQNPIEIPVDVFTSGNDTDRIYKVVEQMPIAPPQFDSAINTFIKSSYPNIKSSTMYKIIIETDGTVSNTRIINTDNKDIGKLGKEFIQLSKGWIPGKQRGQAKRVEIIYKLITF